MRTFVYSALPFPGSDASKAAGKVELLVPAHKIAELLADQQENQWQVMVFDAKDPGSRISAMPGDLFMNVFESGALYRQRNLMSEKP